MNKNFSLFLIVGFIFMASIAALGWKVGYETGHEDGMGVSSRRLRADDLINVVATDQPQVRRIYIGDACIEITILKKEKE